MNKFISSYVKDKLLLSSEEKNDKYEKEKQLDIKDSLFRINKKTTLRDRLWYLECH
jgi:hypothetical protein